MGVTQTKPELNSIIPNIDRIRPNIKHILEVKTHVQNGKLYNQSVKFLDFTDVEIYPIENKEYLSKSSSRLVLKISLKPGEFVGLFEPFKKNVKQIPLKVGEILYYSSPTKHGYIVYVDRDSKFTYMVDEYTP